MTHTRRRVYSNSRGKMVTLLTLKGLEFIKMTPLPVLSDTWWSRILSTVTNEGPEIEL